MKNIILLTIALIGCYLGNAQQSQAEQKKWTEYATPGEMHQLLAKNDGTWKEEIAMWSKPGAEPIKWTTTSKCEMIMGGRYQQSVTTGDINGMQFNGGSITGYDNARRVFCTTWIDNMGTGIMYGEGRYRQGSKSIEFKGKMTDPMTRKEVPFREVLTFVDDTHQKMVMYMPAKRKEYKSMEINMTKD